MLGYNKLALIVALLGVAIRIRKVVITSHPLRKMEGDDVTNRPNMTAVTNLYNVIKPFMTLNIENIPLWLCGMLGVLCMTRSPALSLASILLIKIAGAVSLLIVVKPCVPFPFYRWRISFTSINSH